MQSGCVKRHAENTVHHVATNLFLSPDRPVSELLPYDLKDQALFRGNVPQASDWIRAWAACKNATSFRKAQKFYETEDYTWGRETRVDRKSSLPAI